jgi:arylsulfatase
VNSFVGATWVGALVSACLFAALACERTAPPIGRPERVLLVTVDTLREDHVGDAGRYPEPTMPFVDALLARGTRFTRAVTPIPRTTQALASLLTGQYPYRTGVRVLVDRLHAEAETVAQMAQRRGYRTVAIVSNHLLTRRRGLDRGFDVYDSAGDNRGADTTTDAALASVREIAPETPLFLWVHYIDPHVPYHPPKALAENFDPDYSGRYKHHFGASPGAIGNRAYPRDLPKRFAVFANPLPDAVNEHIRTLYAADIRFTDDEIARLVRGLEQRFGPDWLIIVTADHGESLGEHDFYYDHGDYVYEASIRVPLGIVLPGEDREAGRIVEAPVSLVDVTPTVVELLELLSPDEAAERFEGRSLVPYLRGQTLPERPVFAECGRSFFPGMIKGRVRFDVRGRFRAVVEGDWKLIWTPGQAGRGAYQLYDVASDPDETRDQSGRHPERVRDLRRMLDDWMVAQEQWATGPIPDEEKDALRALGYIDD